MPHARQQLIVVELPVEPQPAAAVRVGDGAIGSGERQLRVADRALEHGVATDDGDRQRRLRPGAVMQARRQRQRGADLASEITVLLGRERRRVAAVRQLAGQHTQRQVRGRAAAVAGRAGQHHTVGETDRDHGVAGLLRPVGGAAEHDRKVLAGDLDPLPAGLGQLVAPKLDPITTRAPAPRRRLRVERREQVFGIGELIGSAVLIGAAVTVAAVGSSDEPVLLGVDADEERRAWGGVHGEGSPPATVI